MIADMLMLALACLIAAFLLRAVWEPTRVELTCVRLSADNPAETGGQTDSDPVLRILFFSDLHMDLLRVREQRLTRAMHGLRADLILFGGDLTAKTACVDSAVSLLTRLRRLPGLAQAPLLAVPGNHDTPDALEALKEAGIVVLKNQSYLIHCRGQTWQIVGLDDKRNGCPDIAAALQDGAAAQIPPGRRLVLVHNPDTLLAVPSGQVRWFCAGHFHGGQIWMPFKLEFRILRDEQLPLTGCYKGLVTWGDMTGYISRGLGCVLFPLRFRSIPELTYLEFYRPGSLLPADRTEVSFCERKHH